MSESYTLNIEIADDDLKIIKEGGYNVCLTKGVKYQSKDLPGNVVFSMVGTKNVAPKLEFTLKDQYQTYMTSKFQAGVPVSSGTKAYDIAQGMTANFDDHGSAKVTGGADQAKPIVVGNGWKAGGRIAIANIDQSTGKYATNFISLTTLMDSTNNLTPIRKLGVFFHGEYVTDTMIDVSQTKPFPVDLTGKESVTVRYEDGGWSII